MHYSGVSEQIFPMTIFIVDSATTKVSQILKLGALPPGLVPGRFAKFYHTFPASRSQGLPRLRCGTRSHLPIFYFGDDPCYPLPIIYQPLWFWGESCYANELKGNGWPRFGESLHCVASLTKRRSPVGRLLGQLGLRPSRHNGARAPQPGQSHPHRTPHGRWCGGTLS